MKRAYIRSTIFNIAFYIATAVLSVLYIPLLLLPEDAFIAMVRFWLRVVTFLEYTILGLKYEVLGRENIPKGAFLIAAKHQSAYETLKMHLIFHDPAIILKKELLYIPLFGSYLKKSGAIAIDRSTPETALRSIQQGVLRIKALGRPTLIFPQGTRVNTDTMLHEKPYKPGIARIQQVTDLPIVPVALNSGLFWPKNSWFKSPGLVTFQILEPIFPGKDRQDLMTDLEVKIEQASNILAAEPRKPRHRHTRLVEILKLVVLLGVIAGAGTGYCAWWQNVAATIRQRYAELHRDAVIVPEISGFPGKMVIRLPEEKITTPDGDMTVKDILITGFPLPLAPIHATASEITVTSFKWAAPLILTDAEVYATYWNKVVTVKDSLIEHDDFRASAQGTIDFRSYPPPMVTMDVSFLNHAAFMQYLSDQHILDQQSAMFMSAGFSALQGPDGVVHVPVTQKGYTLYAGPFAFAQLPESKEPLTTDLPSEVMGSPPGPSQ